MCQISYAYNNFEQLPKFVRREFLWSFPPAGTMARGVGDGEWGMGSGGLSVKHNDQCVDNDLIIIYREGSLYIS